MIRYSEASRARSAELRVARVGRGEKLGRAIGATRNDSASPGFWISYCHEGKGKSGEGTGDNFGKEQVTIWEGMHNYVSGLDYYQTQVNVIVPSPPSGHQSL